jgi:hypothetical protein
LLSEPGRLGLPVLADGCDGSLPPRRVPSGLRRCLFRGDILLDGTAGFLQSVGVCVVINAIKSGVIYDEILCESRVVNQNMNNRLQILIFV